MIGKLYGYTFSFDDGVTPVACSPLIDSLVWADERDDELGIYRRKLDTGMVFSGADFSYLYDFEVLGCGDLDLVIEYKGAEVYRGVILFGTSNVSVDIKRCLITVQIDPQDAYTCLLNSWTEERDLFIVSDRYMASTEVGLLEYETCITAENNSFIALFVNGAPVTCLSSDDPGGLFEDWALIFWEIEEVSAGVWRSVATWAREVATIDCDGATAVAPPGDGWFLQSDDCAGDSNSTWVRAPGRVFLPQESIDDVPNEQYRQVWRVSGVPQGETQRPSAEYGNAVRLKDVLPALANFCDLTVVSDFYDISPDGTAPANSEYAAAAEDLANLLIYQKSDVKRPAASNPANRAIWSLSGLFKALQAMHDVSMRVDGAVLRIEHITYWSSPAVGLNLTIPPFNSTAEADVSYSNNGDKVVRQERWAFSEEVSFEFRGFPIHYPGCVPIDSGEESLYPIDRTNNDMSFITANEERVSDDGFVFASAYLVGAALFIPYINMPSTLGGGLVLNAAMSIPLLLDKYQRTRRPLLDGILNAQNVTFASAIPRREFAEVTIKLPRAEYHDDFNPDDIITTVLGGAEVQTTSYDAVDCTLSLTMRV